MFRGFSLPLFDKIDLLHTRMALRVSIITACLNSAKYLPECIASVRNQTYPDIEYIIVDGKSTDDTFNIILSNMDFVSQFICEPDRGMYDAINKGIKKATGDIVGILNSDDIFASEDTVSNIVASFNEHATDAVYGDLVYVMPEDTASITRYWKGKQFNRNYFRIGWMPAHPTFYIRRELILQYGLYENHFYTAADYEFMARYLFTHRCSATYMKEIIVKMRNGGISNGNLKRRLRANRRDYLAMKKNKIPFALLVSILKPLSKLHQYKTSLLKQARMSLVRKPDVKYIHIHSEKISDVEIIQ